MIFSKSIKNKTPVSINIGLIFLGLLSSSAYAAKTELGTIGSNFKYEKTYDYNQSDYVSEQNIASDTLYFNLTSEQSIYFFADNFNFTNPTISEFRQIDILDVNKTIAGQHDNNWIVSIGDYYKGLDGGPSNFTYTLGPGSYQINYKSRGLEQNYTAGRVVGTAVEGLGDYRLGLTVGNNSLLASPVAGVSAVPEPETYVILLAGLGLIGFVARRRNTI